MTVSAVHIEHYRSIRALILPLGQINIVVGGNGSGKSNIYRALRLLHAGAIGRLAEAIADEGGMHSALYAGPKRRDEIHEVRLRMGVDFDGFSYRLACGLPVKRPLCSPTAFTLDPEVKEEDIGFHVAGRKRPLSLCERRGQVVTLRNQDGARHTLSEPFDANESMLSQLADPKLHPEIGMVRLVLSGWRFYHQFRCDPDAPMRRPRLGVRSPVLADVGRNLAAVLQTIRELEHDSGLLDAAIAKAFPGCTFDINGDDKGYMQVRWRQPGIHRALDARELSDGTLRFLCLAAALLTPRPPGLMVFNEPESSLHESLLPALADLITSASTRCQMVVTTHATELAERIAAITGRPQITLTMSDGQTRTDSDRRSHLIIE